MPISPEPLEGDVAEYGIKKAMISYKDCDMQNDLTKWMRPIYMPLQSEKITYLSCS